MRSSLLLLATAFLSPVAHAGDLARAALKEWLSSAVKTTSAAQGPAIEYCPDNTCERLQAKRHARLSELEDFALLYFATMSEYSYLKDSRPKDAETLLAAVSSSYAANCTESAGSLAVECALKYLRQRLGVTLLSVRYDEGLKCTEPQALLGAPPSSKLKSRCVKSAA